MKARLRKTHEKYFKVNFNSVSDSTRFYRYLSGANLRYELKIKYSRMKWEDIPISVQNRILKGFY